MKTFGIDVGIRRVGGGPVKGSGAAMTHER